VPERVFDMIITHAYVRTPTQPTRRDEELG
jgi:hypothetical protein